MKFPLFATAAALLITACSEDQPAPGPEPAWMAYESLVAGYPASAQVYVDLDSSAFIPRAEELEFDLDSDGKVDIRIQHDYTIESTRFVSVGYHLRFTSTGWEGLPYLQNSQYRLEGLSSGVDIDASLEWEETSGTYMLGNAHWDTKEDDFFLLGSSNNPRLLPLRLLKPGTVPVYYVLEIDYGWARASQSEFRLRSVALRQSL